MPRLVVVLLLSILTSCTTQHMQPSRIPVETIRYVPLGDSYTAGTGVKEEEAFPTQLVDLLHTQGFRIQLEENLAVAGATSEYVLHAQLPNLRSEHPTFSTLLIGANDVYRGVSADAFRVNMGQILDDVLAVLPTSKPLIVMTIPDFTLTPIGRQVNRGRDVQRTLDEFNRIIREEASSRSLVVVDFSTLSLDFGRLDIGLDNVHPSARGHTAFATALLKPAVELLALPEDY